MDVQLGRGWLLRQVAKTVYKLLLQVVGEIILGTKEDDTATRYCSMSAPKVRERGSEQYW